MGGRQQPLNSCQWLERPAAWRPIALAVLLALVTVPVWPLVWSALAGGDWPELVKAPSFDTRAVMSL